MSEDIKRILSNIYAYANYDTSIKKQMPTQKNNVILSRLVDGNYKPNISTYQVDYNKPNRHGQVCYIRPNF